ncbi:hypothetical protein D9M70_618050 [compost metagenome]
MLAAARAPQPGCHLDLDAGIVLAQAGVDRHRVAIVERVEGKLLEQWLADRGVAQLDYKFGDFDEDVGGPVGERCTHRFQHAVVVVDGDVVVRQRRQRQAGFERQPAVLHRRAGDDDPVAGLVAVELHASPEV